jgi:GNAT superfamily N-acetyltransferase
LRTLAASSIIGASQRERAMAPSRAGLVIRRLEHDDLAAALALQAASYPAFLREGSEAFASRLTAAASYCLAAMRGEALVAYLLAHGWASEAPPPVGTVIAADGPGEVLYVHDLAVSSDERGSGLGRQLIGHAFDLARRDGFRRAELIAVEGAAGYWRSLGFVESPPTSALAAKVATYGSEARWMTLDLPG